MQRLTACAITALLSLPVQAQEVVNVYNWSDYIDQSIIEDFTAETGIEVVYDVFDSNDLLETKLLAGGTGYDVVVPSHGFMSRQIQAGVFQPLDKTKLPNLENMWPLITERLQIFDPENAHSVNYMWGTTGFGYNEDMVKARIPDAPLNSWALVFEPENLAKLADCGVYFLDSADEVIPLVMNYLGLDPDSKEAADFETAGERLMELRPHIRKFHSSEYISALANGDICLAIGWSGDVIQAADRALEAENNVSVVYSIPKEGAQLWFDQMAIPKDAPNPDNAHTFINFMMRPEIMARATNYVYYANGNLASQQHILPEILGDTSIYPDDDTMERLFVVRTYGPREQRALNRVWTRVKTGQ